MEVILGKQTLIETFSATLNFRYRTKFSFLQFLAKLVSELLISIILEAAL